MRLLLVRIAPVSGGIGWFSGYSLAIACVVAPLVLGWTCEFVVYEMLRQPIRPPAFSYRIHPIASPQTDRQEPICTSSSPASSEPTATAAESKDKQSDPIPCAHLVALHLAGQFNYAAASGFRYLVAAVGFFFGATVLWRQLRPRTLALSIGFCLVVAGVTGSSIEYLRRAALLLAGDILTAADGTLKDFPRRMPDTGAFMVRLESVNYAIGLLGVLMVFFALAAVSLRDPRRAPTAADLDNRRTVIQIALGLISASLVVAVLSTRILLDWSLSLLAYSQQAALKPLSDAIIMRWGAIGTIALFAAVIPAVAAWQLDVARYRAANAARGEGDGSGVAPHDDGFKVSWAPMIASIVAAFAPILASPFVDALKLALPSLGGR